jgi:hypothetical protein
MEECHACAGEVETWECPIKKKKISSKNQSVSGGWWMGLFGWACVSGE